MARAAVILAAGQGTRMKSDLPKVLHTVDGVPMVRYVIDTVHNAGIERVVIIVGYKAERVREACVVHDTGDDNSVEFALQSEQLGTGHAVMQAKEALDGFDGTLVILNGDVPGLRASTLTQFVEEHDASGATATVMTARLDNPAGYGRIVRGEDGSLLRIVEHKDGTDDERAIDEINSGLFCFDASSLFSALGRAGRDNVQNEYYLTDAIETLRNDGLPVAAWCVKDSREVAGVNTVDELESIRQFLKDGQG